MFNPIGNPTCWTKIEIDTEPLDQFLKEYNDKNPDKRLSYTIIGIKSIGELMKKAFSFKISFENNIKISP